MKALRPAAATICSLLLIGTLQANGDEAKPISKADLDRLVGALWTEPPPTAEPPCGLEIKLVRKTYKEPQRAEIETMLRSAYKDQADVETIVASETERAMQEKSKPHYYREHVLTCGSNVRVDQTKLTSASDPKQVTDEIFVNLGRLNKDNFRSYHVWKPNEDLPGQYERRIGKGSGWHLADYARLGAIPNPLLLQLYLCSSVRTEDGDRKILPDQKIAACASQQPEAARILLQSGEPVQGRATVVIILGWSSSLANAPATPMARWTLDKEDMRICYRAETFDRQTGVLSQEWTAEGFSSIQGAAWSFPKQTVFQKYDPKDHWVVEYEKCSAESVGAKPSLTEESFIPPVPPGYNVNGGK